MTNWSDYNASLRQRDSLTPWFSEDAIAGWRAAPRTTRGGEARYSPLAILLSELLPMSGTQHASTVRNTTKRVSEIIVKQQPSTNMAKPVDPVVVGLDGDYVGNRHGGEERYFEVIAGKVIDGRGRQHRFAFVRNGPVTASDAFKQVIATVVVDAKTPVIVLCDGDAGLWRL